MISTYISVIIPLLIHIFLSTAVLGIWGGRLDSAACTLLTAAFTIPIASWLMIGDCRKKQIPVRQIFLPVSFIYCICSLILGALLNVLWSNILLCMEIGEHFSNQAQERLFSGAMLVQVFGLCFIIPLAEELIFRGLIYQRLKNLMPVWGAVLFSALLFAFYHGNAIQIIFALPMAVILAILYEKGNSFLYPLLFHIGANSIAVFLNFR